MLTKKEMQERIPFIQEWLDERWYLAHCPIFEDSRPQPLDMCYYNGAIRALEFMGLSWRRDANGKHTVY